MQSTLYTISLQSGFKRKAIITNSLPTSCVYKFPYGSPVFITIPGTTDISIQQYHQSNICFEAHSISTKKDTHIIIQVKESFVLFFCHITTRAIYFFNNDKGFYVIKGRHCLPLLMKPGRCKFIFKPGNYDYLLFSIPKELFAKKISTAGFTYLQKKGDRFLSGVDLLPVLPISAATKKLIKQLQQADKTNEHIETNLMNVFLQLLAKYDTQSSNAEKNATIATEELADKAKEYILAMIKNGNSKSIPEIAELLGTTPSRMARAFKHKFHLTLKELIKEERMITARNLLSIKGTSPAMVSAYLGYSRISSLIREYKKRWGTWPQ